MLGYSGRGARSLRTAQVDGFNVHAGVTVKAVDRVGLERLCRYGARAPFSLQPREALRPWRRAQVLQYPESARTRRDALGGVVAVTGLVLLLVGVHRVPVDRDAESASLPTVSPSFGHRTGGLTVRF